MTLKFLMDDTRFKRNFSIACLYPQNYIIETQGSRCRRVGHIEKGRVQMIYYSRQGEAALLAELEAGDFFGDFLVFADRPFYPGTLIAATEASIVFISREDLRKTLDADKTIEAAFLKHLSNKALGFSIQNKLLRLPSLRDKILFHLRQEMVRSNKDHVVIDDQETLAALLDVRRPSLSRELARMRDEGILLKENKSYRLKDS